MKAQAVELKANWRWKERNITIDHVWDEVSRDEGWSPVRAGMPSELHVELMKTLMIPDPYIGFNEHKVQCKLFSLFRSTSLLNKSNHLLFRGRRKRMVIYDIILI